MKYLLLLLALISFSACTEDPRVPILNRDQVEGIWEGNWTTNGQGGRDLIHIQFTSISRTGTFQNVPFNNLGYREGEIVFRYLELVGAQIEGEMLVKFEDPTRNSWMPVEIISLSPSLIVSVDCIDCANNTLILERL
ncbi:MAG: hypothetical protein ACRBFS_07480 [Aureispira sp.]